jgi:hypothetical protein
MRLFFKDSSRATAEMLNTLFLSPPFPFPLVYTIQQQKNYAEMDVSVLFLTAPCEQA